MPAIPPNIDLSGITRNVTDHINAAFKRGVSYGRYLEQQNRKPTPRGTWEDCDVFGFSGMSVYRCSACKNTRWGGKTNYCQFCGANMMEEKKE